MRRLSFTTLAFAVALFGSAVYAQQPAAPSPPAPPPYGPPITIEQAKKVAVAALAEAKKTSYDYAFAIVNPSGNLVYFEKTDDVLTASINIAIGKAQTSATLKRPSKALFDQMETGHPYVATLYPGIVAAAGGVPIVVDGKIIGAIGVSGSPTGLIDEKAALAGAAAVK
jgi:glc operon protein GlcG